MLLGVDKRCTHHGEGKQREHGADQSHDAELLAAKRRATERIGTIIAAANLPSDVPANASQMYAKNLSTFLVHLAPEGELVLDLEDEITAGAMLTHDGEIVNEAVRVRAAAES